MGNGQFQISHVTFHRAAVQNTVTIIIIAALAGNIYFGLRVELRGRPKWKIN